jgi:RND family efflux transporter MFP subunit
MSPIYVVLSLPQRQLDDLRDAMTRGTARVAATTADGRKEEGQVEMIENTIDTATGMIAVRGLMPNTSEVLWPGALVPVVLTMRTEEAITVPSVAVQRSQRGDFVFVVQDGKATMVPVKVQRTQQGLSVIADGLNGGETVVTDGQLLLSQGTPVAPRNAPAEPKS